MMAAMEPLLYTAGADIVISGHVHAYERSVYYFDPFRIFDCSLSPQVSVDSFSLYVRNVCMLENLILVVLCISLLAMEGTAKV